MDYRASGSGADPWQMKGVDPSMLLMDSGKRTGDCLVMRPRSTVGGARQMALLLRLFLLLLVTSLARQNCRIGAWCERGINDADFNWPR